MHGGSRATAEIGAGRHWVGNRARCCPAARLCNPGRPHQICPGSAGGGRKGWLPPEISGGKAQHIPASCPGSSCTTEKGKGGGNPALPLGGGQANKRIPGGRCQEGEGAGCSLSSPGVTACPVTNPGGPRDAVTHRPYFGKLRQGHSSCSRSRCQGPSSSGRRLGHGPRCHCGFLRVSVGFCGFLWVSAGRCCRCERSR